ncbi:amino acid adenylation domain-containing protein, partial [Xenorhabdus sp. SGI246]|uniref:non-ribosomal peptide synthetase n=1 Tax=Xenorhabdus sp. SGI246 TaxID=3158263 RepID=UPI00349F50E7
MWFIDQFENGISAYNIQSNIKICGNLNVLALKKAINFLVNRHDSLRTNFIYDDEGVRQSIKNSINVELSIFDFSCFDDIKKNDEMKRVIMEGADKKFNLSCDTLCRVSLIKTRVNEYVFSITLHHIITDGWSSNIIIRELSELYNSFSNGCNNKLKALKYNYRDYTLSHRKWLIENVIDKRIKFWDEYLKNHNKLISLPIDKERPKKQTYSGGRVYFELPNSLVKSLNLICKEENVTPFILMLSSIKLLLAKYTNDDDICIGTAVSNRNNMDIENLVGLFMNILVIRTRIDKNDSFIKFLEKTKNNILEVFKYQEVPFECVVNRLVNERHLNHSPLFQVMFLLHDVTNNNIYFKDLVTQEIKIENKTSKYDLSIELFKNNDGLNGFFEYNSDIFHVNKIQRIVKNFIHLLNEIANNIHLNIFEYNAIDLNERYELLTKTNGKKNSDYSSKKIIDLIERQANIKPDSIAIKFNNEEITYRQLSHSSNRLAKYLISSDSLTNNKLIGVCLDKSINLIISIIGIWKAGGAYLPLDGNYPIDRLRYFINDSSLRMILSDNNNINKFDFIKELSVCVDSLEFQSILNSFSEECVDINKDYYPQDELAYVIYTSGSTGNPKGVKCSHKSLMNFILSINSEFNLNNEEVLLSVTPFSFDISILEFFLPLSFGHQLILMPHEKTSSGYEIKETIEVNNVTIMQATPVTWNMLANGYWPNINHKLKVLCGGEALSINLANKILKNNVEFWNLYGPTETTIWASTYKLHNFCDRKIPIGKPINNINAYILDESLNLLPLGVEGDLYLSGVALSLGYLNKEELTSEYFINNPYCTNNDSKDFKFIYKTGDRACWTLDHNLEFCGRNDNQVKIRGFRIELGEIEKAILDLNFFKNIVVSPCDSIDGNKTLVAYYIINREIDFDLIKIKERLSNVLPSYMVP